VCVGEDVVERLAIIPEQAHVIRHHAKKYACHEPRRFRGRGKTGGEDGEGA
jgi:transposase